MNGMERVEPRLPGSTACAFALSSPGSTRPAQDWPHQHFFTGEEGLEPNASLKIQLKVAGAVGGEKERKGKKDIYERKKT